MSPERFVKGESERTEPCPSGCTFCKVKARARFIHHLAVGPFCRRTCCLHLIFPDFHLTTRGVKSKCFPTSLVSVKCLQTRPPQLGSGVTVPMGWLAIPPDTNFLQASL